MNTINSPEPKRLLLFNLMMDEANSVLAIACDWAYEFAERFDEVVVFSTHVGLFDPKTNLTVIEIGGGNLIARIRGIWRIAVQLIRIRPNSTDVAFHHMSTKSLFWPGIYLKSRGVKQALWYSHSKYDVFLKLGLLINPKVFTPNQASFPLDKRGLRKFVVGHGVVIDEAAQLVNVMDTPRQIDCVYVGRISKIKRIESLIDAIDCLRVKTKISIGATLIGPVESESYLRELQLTAKVKNVSLKFLGPKSRNELHQILLNANMIFTNTPKSTDKAVIEAAMLGCLVVSAETETLKLCGMTSVLEIESLETGDPIESLTLQIQRIYSMDQFKVQLLRKKISEYNRNRHALSNLIDKIEKGLSNE